MATGIKTAVILATRIIKLQRLQIRQGTDDDPCVGCLFELERSDLDELMKREHRYEVHEVDAYELPSEPAEGMILDARNSRDRVRVVVFVESTDERYHAKCDSDDLSSCWSAL
jgi:hypothetical protein